MQLEVVQQLGCFQEVTIYVVHISLHLSAILITNKLFVDVKKNLLSN